MFGISLDRWFSIANAVYLGGVVIAAVASLAIYQISQEISARDAVEKQTARDQVEIAKAESAKANERAARLENEAAAARLEQERLKAALAWRTLSKEASETLLALLSESPGSVNLRYTDGDPEALFLAIQLSNLLVQAKWRIAAGSLKFENALAFAIYIYGDDSTDTKNLREAFSRASIPFTTEAPPPIGVAFSVSTIEGAPILLIGSKAPWFNSSLSKPNGD